MSRNYLVSTYVFMFVCLCDVLMADIVSHTEVTQVNVWYYWMETQALAHLLGIQV